MPPSLRYTVRLPPPLDAQVQARIRAGTPFAVIVREALIAYLADTPPTEAPTLPRPCATSWNSWPSLYERLKPWSRRRQHPADTPPTGADSSHALACAEGCPPFDATKNVLGRLCPRGHEWGTTGQSLRRLPNQSCRLCENEQRRVKRAARLVQHPGSDQPG